MTTISNTVKKARHFISERALLSMATVHVALLSTHAVAQDDGKFKMPTATIPGVADDADSGDMMIGFLKYGGLLLAWVFVIFMGFAMLKNIVKSINKVRRDEDTKWADVAGDIIGNALVMVLVVVLATWLTTYLT